MINENLDIFFQDLTDLATYKDSQFLGFFDEESVSELGVEERAITFTLKSSDTEGMRHGDFIYIKETPYQIINIYPEMDGKITRLELQHEQA